MPIEFLHEPVIPHGELIEVAPLVRRIVAKNPSPFTYHGTSTYVVGRGKVAVIDPGPALAEHIDALLESLASEGEEISHVLVTHTHADHSPAACVLAERLGVDTYGFGPHGEGKYERGEKVEAGADYDFDPTHRVGDGDVIAGDGFALECVHTPGHAVNHLCFALRDTGALFTGDHVMGWSTSIVSPPDGEMGAYLASLQRLLVRDDRVYFPAHGPSIEEPKPLVRAFVEHRREREHQVLECLALGIDRIPDMVERMYASVPAWLHGAAARSVLAHVLDLHERGRVTCDGEPSLEQRYRLRA